jgi:membrane protein implicated in regulation of membrane protease activity
MFYENLYIVSISKYVNTWGGCMKPEIVWLIIGVILVIMEFAVPGVILVFFGVGAILTAILAWTGILNSVAVQAIFLLYPL